MPENGFSNPYFPIEEQNTDAVLILENMGYRKSVFWNFLPSIDTVAVTEFNQFLVDV